MSVALAHQLVATRNLIVSCYYPLNSSLISSTFDGWQQMATEDLEGSNSDATYFWPTLIRSAKETWEIVDNRDLYSEKENQSNAGA